MRSDGIVVARRGASPRSDSPFLQVPGVPCGDAHERLESRGRLFHGRHDCRLRRPILAPAGPPHPDCGDRGRVRHGLSGVADRRLRRWGTLQRIWPRRSGSPGDLSINSANDCRSPLVSGTGLGTFPMSFPPLSKRRCLDLGDMGSRPRHPSRDRCRRGTAADGIGGRGLDRGAGHPAPNGIRTRRRDLIVPVSAFAVAIISILHAIVDFSLQIPGYAIVVFALCRRGACYNRSVAIGERS